MTFFSFIFDFFLNISFSHSFFAQACASRGPIFIPAKQASPVRRANFTSVWVYELKKFSSLILNYWQPNLLCLFLSFVKLIKSVFKILFNLMKLFLCFHLSYLNLGESIKHNQMFGQNSKNQSMQKDDSSLFFVTFSNHTVVMMIDFDWNEKYILF